METLPITIDFQSKEPLSSQIAERIRVLIQAQVMRPGDPLPTVRQLAFQLGVNFNTVARAYRALDAEGLLVTWQGRGTFVEEQKGPEDQKNHFPDAQQLVDAIFEQARVFDIPEPLIWEALNQRMAAAPIPAGNVQKKKPSRSTRTRKRNSAGKPTSRGISLRRKGFTTYARIPGTKRKPRNVSRGT